MSLGSFLSKHVEHKNGHNRSSSEYDSFFFSAAHADYIRDAVRKRNQNDVSAPFWAFRLEEHEPQLGDLVCGWRNRRVSLDTVPDSGFFPSHCDIVAIKRVKTVQVIGGNVGNSVKVKSFSLDERGFLDPSKQGQRSLFAVLRNESS